MQFLASLVLISLGCGGLLQIYLADRRAFGPGFVRLLAWLFGTFVVLGTVLSLSGSGGPPWGAWSVLLTLAAVAALAHALAVGSGKRGLEEGLRPLILAPAWIGCAQLGALVLELPDGTGFLTVLAAAVTSGLVTGGALGAMLTGHWYLIDRKLDFAILERSNLALGVAALLKAGVIAGTLAMLHARESAAFQPFATAWSGPWLLLAVRTFVGIVAPLALVAMIHDCVRRRSNQSATGLLYVLVCLVLGGEGASLLLAAMTGAWL